MNARISIAWLATNVVLLCCVQAASAGGGPENLAIVVNAASEDSRKIAAAYAGWRRVPAGNVISLKGIPEGESISVDDFREKILRPVLATLKTRGLTKQIHCIAYSGDFPTAVDVKTDIGGRKLLRVFTPKASLNGLTFLYQQVLAKDVRYLNLGANYYHRRPQSSGGVSKPLAREALLRMVDALKAANNEQKWEAAAETLTELAKDYPEHAAIRYNLACMYAQMKQPEKAIEELNAAIKLGWWNRRRAERDDDFQSLRDKPEFKKALTAMTGNRLGTQPSMAFRSSDAFASNGDLTETDGQKYLLSTMLAVTRGRGNTVEEALAYLKRSVDADGTKPTGTVYLMQNGNVRSTTRDGAFPSVAAQLKTLGVRAEIVQGTIPQGKKDVQGAVIGTAIFDWKAAGSQIQPGAICEHLTSFGGVMRKNAGQTPLTDLLRHGAAGASGTVTEPFAIAAKFPSPFIHVHYARGCNLAEAFYQSVAGPFQLLIVGDPLCQPWATSPQVTLSGIKSGQTLRGRAVFQAKADVPVKRWELYIDGVHHKTLAENDALQFDFTEVRPGKHELRIVAVANTPIATRGRVILKVDVIK